VTEFEKETLSDALTSQTIDLGQLQASHIAIYLTIVFAFIIAAFAAGKRLTAVQVRVATVLFVIAGLVEVYQIVITGVGIHYLTQLNASQYGAQADFGMPLGLRVILNTLLWSSGVIGALIFMWNVRKSDDE
jgi:hypothetical protein